MDRIFVEAHRGALALLVTTLLASAALEWAVTARERIKTTVPAGAGLADRGRVILAALVESTTARTSGAANADRGTKRVIIGGVALAIVLAFVAARRIPEARLPGSGWIWIGIGLPLMWLGIGLRVWAIAVLGRFFRRVVVIQEGHTVVSDGPCRVIRHPAYAGNLLAVAGLGLVLANLASLAVLLVLPFLAHRPRIRVEETELTRSLGDAYREYCATTKRLIPGVW